ncbi:MAG TPA: hypothetical protein VFS30_08665 [Dehalococcoidia bacterium]|nr:hypothetical protein [Dehalococcoidia bacterium]
MGLLSKLFGGGKKQEVAAEGIALECPHSLLVPRWDSVQDMGIEDKATRFLCEACKEEFDPAAAAELRATLAQRLARIDSDADGAGGAGA